jgi:hypothetical protein
VGTGGIVGSGGVLGSGGVVATGGASLGGASAGGTPAIGGASSGGIANGGTAGVATGGVPSGGAAGATGGAGGASGGAAGAAGAAGAGGAGGGIDLTGTWISEVKTKGQVTAPVVNTVDSDIDLVIRLSLTKAAGKLNGTFAICKLTTNGTNLTVTFPDPVLATMHTTISENDFTAMVGSNVPVPDIEILTGQDAQGNKVDSDNDMNDGVTVPSKVLGLVMINAYMGLDIKVSLTGKLTDMNTITGTTKFSTTGKVFSSDMPALLSSGNINVVGPDSVPFTSKKLAGDVPCSSVVTMFPAM